MNYLQFGEVFFIDVFPPKCSVAKPCLTLCDSMNCSMPGFPVPEFAQIHVHWGGDTVESSLLSPRSPPVLSLSQHQGLFQRVGSRHQVAKVLELQFIISPSSEYSGSILFRIGASLVAQRLKHLPAKGLTGLRLLSKGLLRALWYKLCMYPWCHSRGASSRLKKTMLTMLWSKVNECTRTTHFLPNVSDSENSFHFFYLIYLYMQRKPWNYLLKDLFLFLGKFNCTLFYI